MKLWTGGFPLKLYYIQQHLRDNNLNEQLLKTNGQIYTAYCVNLLKCCDFFSHTASSTAVFFPVKIA